MKRNLQRNRISHITKALFHAGILVLLFTTNATTFVSAQQTVDCYKDAYQNPEACRDFILQFPFYSGAAEQCTPSGTGAATSAGTSLPATVPEPHKTIFTEAAAKYNVNPVFLTTLFLSEQGNQWLPPDTKWAVSGSRAAGPFQFIPSSWAAYATDGDGDGKSDVNNMYDAAAAAARLIGEGFKTNISTPLGTLEKPYAKDTFLRAASDYNWGVGNIKDAGIDENSPLSVFRAQTKNYLSNIFTLIESGFTKSGYEVYPDPVPPTGASAPATNTTPSTPSSTTAPSTGEKTVVAIDPGHDQVISNYTDTVTGLIDRETDNGKETDDMFEVASQIKADLEQSGYEVVLLKESVRAGVNKRARVDKAKAANAKIAVSLHSYAAEGGYDGWAEVWPQFVGGYREIEGKPDTRVTFTNQETAKLSDQYSDIIREERDKAERNSNGATEKVTGNAASFGSGRGLPSVGDISLVQLWSDNVPWVYNEVGTDGGGMTAEQKQKYALGVANGIKRAVPSTGAATTTGTGCGASGGNLGNGNAVTTALLFAWPNARGRGFVEMKPEYAEAVKRAQSAKPRQYVGGTKYPGVDCGGFVTRVMIESGYEPRYNCDGKQCPISSGRGTEGQLNWARENWQKIGQVTDTSQLQPGDVAFYVTASGGNDGHTFMYVGSQPGFETEIASASWDQRAPMAGTESAVSGRNIVEWYRKK